MQEFERKDKRENIQANATALAYYDCELPVSAPRHACVVTAIGQARYGRERWASIRLGLVSTAKYVCVVNSIISRPGTAVDKQLMDAGANRNCFLGVLECWTVKK